MDIVTTKEVEKKLDDHELIHLIDVREVDEVLQGVIPGVTHIPLGLLEFRLHELDKSKEYIMVCRSGNRSGIAAQFLESQGFHVKNMVGGMLEWEGKVVQKNFD
ncbi:rhodanese-like domain-containing protein [Chengkuizengella axinellae]|uniref:Rhodanese-like domain-containing protein n=1 Tax=Chengkuizengella axinellae TaxID=3064388 RepID=A0ABT9J5D7_9BACL|nr:rhodanese-like domain-containing protein [Chengkuizengella sp. 2205SS18-9]MDP5276677.1 rhodanese-like domain-containing protein [Chengkuizengella sp. 2205SS18-9]